jgi:CheY-like chemotaxis protein
MPDGGRLTIETANVVLDEDYGRAHVGVAPGPYVMIVVSDTGVGMDEAIKRYIFEPFFTTKGPGQGTGLGLATCYGIVKQHGGTIEVYSEPHQGTSFKIYLPRVEGVAERLPPPEPNAAVIPRGTEMVLLVEDEPGVRGLSARILSDLGYVVLQAADGEEALRIAQAHADARIDLLLTDVVMPKLGGRQLAEHVAALFPGIKVLFTSGYTQGTVVQHSRLDRNVAFLPKPFTAAALARKVREMLDR